MMTPSPLVARSRRAKATLVLSAGVPFFIEAAHLLRERGESPRDGDVVEQRAPGWLIDAVSMGGLTIGVLSVWPARTHPLRASRTCFVAGIAAIWSGMALREWAHRTLGRFHRGDVTVHADHELVTEGPYAHIRHPLYAASLVVFSGIGMALGTRVSVVASTVLPTAALLHRIRIEEAAISRSPLAPAFADYASEHPALIPRVW
jgi:protein-S-isoprenylcysteine O-methyltransferase Ste14